MISHKNMERGKRNDETKLYKIRWWIIFLIGFSAVLARALRSSFGVVNDIYVAYFDVTYETVDWFTLIVLPGGAVSCVIYFALLISDAISTKQLAILMSGCFTFTCVCLIIAYVYAKLYPLIFVGNFVLGFVISALDPITASYAISWFPEHQIGIALGSNEIGANMGSLLGYIIPSNLLLVPNQSNSSQKVVCTSTPQNQSSDHEWISKDKVRLIVFSSVLLAFATLILISFTIFMKSKPPLPPTQAQAKVRKQSCQEAPDKLDKKQLRKIFHLFKSVMADKLFLQSVFILSVAVGGCTTIGKVLMAEVFRKFFLELGFTNSYNSMSGSVLVCYESGSVLGSILSGKIVDNFKNYHQQVSIVLACSVISVVSLLLGYHFGNSFVVFLFNFTYGISIGYLPTPLFEIVFQHFYPVETGVLSLIIRILSSLSGLCFGETSRLIANWFGDGMAVLIYLIAILSISFTISLFLKPNYNRLAANRNSESAMLHEEDTPLLTD